MNIAPLDFNPLILAAVPIVAALAYYLNAIVRKQEKLFDSALARNDELIDKLNQTNAHNARLSEVNRELRTDVNELRKQLDKLEKELNNMRQTREAERILFDQRSIEYQTQIASRDHTIAGLQERINNMRIEITDFQKQFREVTEKLNKVGSDYERVVNERDSLRIEKERMEGEIKELQADLKAVGLRNGELEDKVRIMRADLDKIQRPATAVDHFGGDLLLEAKRDLPMNHPAKPEDEPPEAA
jgi:chromosome segregation ATPase